MPEPRVSFWRRIPRPRLSLRVLMLGILVFGGGLGWCIASVRRQTQIVAELERLGYSVLYDLSYRDGSNVEHESPPLTRWLVDRFGVDAMASVTLVYASPFTPAGTVTTSSEPTVQRLGSPADDVESRARTERLVHCLVNLPRLESVGINDRTFTDAHLARLAGCTRLRQIYSPESGLTGAGLVHLKGMTRLESLHISHLRVNDRDLANLAELTNLKQIEVDGQDLTDAGLAQLSKLTKLEWLDLGGDFKTPGMITTQGLGRLSGLVNLQRLIIGASRIESLAPLAGMRSLDHLRVSNAALTDSGLEVLGSGFDRLSTLNLAGNPSITDAGLVHLGRLKQLNILDLSGTAIQGNGLVHLAANPNLIELRLAKASVTDEGLVAFRSGFTGLIHLALADNPGITDAGLAHLTHLPWLTGLMLTRTGITGPGLAHLDSFPKLHLWVSLGGPALTDQGLAQLKTPPRFEYLELHESPVSEAGLAYLLDKTRTEVVTLQGTRITPAGLATLRASFPRCRFRIQDSPE